MWMCAAGDSVAGACDGRREPDDDDAVVSPTLETSTLKLERRDSGGSGEEEFRFRALGW